MATSTIKWNEGDGNIVATYEGSGDGPISLTTDIPNEGIDREQEITIQTTDKNKTVNVLVKQEGLREVFEPNDGLFVLADGGTYNVLKVGSEQPEEPDTSIDVKNYLTIEALEDGLTAKLAVSDVEYCVDGDGKWKALPAATATEAINKGQTLSFRGSETGYSTSRMFTINKSCNVLGDPMSIYVGDNASITTSYKYNYTFAHLFYNCATIVDASGLNLSRTPRAYTCYYMFYGCKALMNAPELPATTIASSCYRRMFQGCTALTKAPVLPALTLQSNCYEYMFASCSKLAEITMLATNISASNCLLGWVNAIKSKGTFYKNKDATWTTTGISGVPSNWTVVLI